MISRGCCVPTTTIKNSAGVLVPWEAVREAIENDQMTFAEAGDKFDIRPHTIANRAKRHLWRYSDRARKVARDNSANHKTSWSEKGEEHRRIAFEKAHESVKRFQPKAPTSFRELEAADRIARRAAGLETAEVVQQTLVHVSEMIEGREAEVFEATQVNPALPDPHPNPDATHSSIAGH
jgi:hypothetical protein